jgi:hypothetical protein
MLRIDDARRRLVREKVLDVSRTVAGLFFQLPDRRVRRFLVRVHHAAGQFPPPAIGHDPVTPQHEHLVVIVQQRDDRRPVQPDHVMPVPFAARQLNVNLPEPHPRAVVNSPLPESPPSPRFVTLCARHALDSNTCHAYTEPFHPTTLRY